MGPPQPGRKKAARFTRDPPTQRLTVPPCTGPIPSRRSRWSGHSPALQAAGVLANDLEEMHVTLVLVDHVADHLGPAPSHDVVVLTALTEVHLGPEELERLGAR